MRGRLARKMAASGGPPRSREYICPLDLVNHRPIRASPDHPAYNAVQRQPSSAAPAPSPSPPPSTPVKQAGGSSVEIEMAGWTVELLGRCTSQVARTRANFQGMDGHGVSHTKCLPESVEIPVSTTDNTTGSCLPSHIPPYLLRCSVIPHVDEEQHHRFGSSLRISLLTTDISSVQRLSQDVVIDIMALVVLLVFSFEPCPGAAGRELLGHEPVSAGLL